MKKIITVTLIFILLLTMFIPASAVTFGGIDWGAAEDAKNQAVQEMLEGRTITYDYNGGWYIQLKGWRATITTEATYESNGTHTIPDIAPWKYGYRFVGWKTSWDAIYQPGEKLQGTTDLTLVAQWERK